MTRGPEIAYGCPSCGQDVVAGLDDPGRCSTCGADAPLDLSSSVKDARVVDRCLACGGDQLYVQRDFNQKVGLGIVVLGGILAPFTPYYASLWIAALIDAVLYGLLPEITVCYRCHAHFRGFARNPQHQPFDLHVAEQYGSHPPPKP